MFELEAEKRQQSDEDQAETHLKIFRFPFATYLSEFNFKMLKEVLSDHVTTLKSDKYMSLKPIDLYCILFQL